MGNIDGAKLVVEGQPARGYRVVLRLRKEFLDIFKVAQWAVLDEPLGREWGQEDPQDAEIRIRSTWLATYSDVEKMAGKLKDEIQKAREAAGAVPISKELEL